MTATLAAAGTPLHMTASAQLPLPARGAEVWLGFASEEATLIAEPPRPGRADR